YFLFTTTPEQLSFLRFPLGDMAKGAVRDIAAELGLSVAAKPDSQDICFVPEGRYTQVVERLKPDAVEPGEIVDLRGRVLGIHPGIVHFTVGQRKGLGLSGHKEPLFVLALDAKNKRVMVGPRAALARDTLRLTEVNWLAEAPPAPEGRRVEVKLRSTQAPAPGTVTATDTGAVVVLDEPQYGVSPGQAAVIYDGTRVLGGGWIAAAGLGEAR
ncbi:MAG: tRNA 2-thiouridine(34) synthase MnmA, partial [Proteobacteria bacterium]|nr:tRNA 2-thiouridine(34) synthase MnmA [Pseudomonadota bacterium]